MPTKLRNQIESNNIMYVPMDNFASFCEINDAGSYFDELKIRETHGFYQNLP